MDRHSVPKKQRKPTNPFRRNGCGPMSRIGPGDLVMAVDTPPPGFGRVLFEKVMPGTIGVALGVPAIRPDAEYPYPSVCVRWPHITNECYTFALRKIKPPPPLEDTISAESEAMPGSSEMRR